MKFKFSKLQYQQDAINSIINVLAGSYTIDDNIGIANPKIYFSDNITNLILAQQKEHKLEHISTCGYDSNQPLNLDLGFKVYEITDDTYHDIYKKPLQDVTQAELGGIDNTPQLDSITIFSLT